MTIFDPSVQTALNNPPQPNQDPDTFNARGFGMAAVLGPMCEQIEAFGANLDSFSVQSSSLSSVELGYGNRTFTLEPGKSFQKGMTGRLAYVTDPTRYVQGIITAYDITTGITTMDVDRVRNSGTYASWNFFTTDLTEQAEETYISAGTQPAYTVVTNLPGVLAANQSLRLLVHATATAAPTLNRDGLGIKNIVQFGYDGQKENAVLYVGQVALLQYDGTEYVVLNPLRHEIKGLTVPLSVTQGGTGLNYTPTPLRMRPIQGRSFNVGYTAASDGILTATAFTGVNAQSGCVLIVAGIEVARSMTTTEGNAGYASCSFAVAAGESYYASFIGSGAASNFLFRPLDRT